MQDMMARQQLQQAIGKFLKAEGVGVILEPGRGKSGRSSSRAADRAPRARRCPSPAIAIATEHYNRIVRILQKNIPVTLEVEVQARFTADDLPGTNIVAEIPGVDKKLKSEIVMLGGHFDTWHAGTGATDDGAGCAVASRP